MKILKILKLIPYLSPILIVYLINLLIILPLDLYSIYSWFDILVHFIGGASVALSSIMILNRCPKIVIKDKLISIIIIVSLVSLVAVLWEFYEALSGFNMILNDTLFDIFMGLLGGLTIATLFGNNVNDIDSVIIE